jgi:hypothetical protein
MDFSYLSISVPGSGAFLTPISGIVKIKVPIRDEYFGSYLRKLRNNFWVKILKFFDADPGSVNLFDPGSGIRDGKN